MSIRKHQKTHLPLHGGYTRHLISNLLNSFSKPNTNNLNIYTNTLGTAFVSKLCCIIFQFFTIIQENSRNNSPIFEMIDVNNFSVGGYSMGGGACQNAAMMDSSLKAIISLNPTVLFEDCDLCPGEVFDGVTYCICLVPELVNHNIPSLIFAGEVEVNELPDYSGMLGQDLYTNMPETTDKIMFEGAGNGHGFAAYPYGEVQEYALNWLKYQLLDDDSVCEILLEDPSSASQYLTNIDCTDSVAGDVNGDSTVNVQDVILAVNLILSNGYNESADLNSDSTIDVLDIVQLVNIILN